MNDAPRRRKITPEFELPVKALDSTAQRMPNPLAVVTTTAPPLRRILEQAKNIISRELEAKARQLTPGQMREGDAKTIQSLINGLAAAHELAKKTDLEDVGDLTDAELLARLQEQAGSTGAKDAEIARLTEELDRVRGRVDVLVPPTDEDET